jgi:hypothetical protein
MNRKTGQNITAPGELSLDEVEKLLPSFAARGARAAQLAEMLNKYVAQRRAEEGREEALETVRGTREGLIESPIRQEVMGQVLRNLGRPELITDEVQRMIESGISSSASDARENFMAAFGERTGAKNMPWVSGPALTGVADFEGKLARATGEETRKARLARIVENEAYWDRSRRAAMAFTGMDADQLMRLAGMEAGIESRTPTIGLGAYGDWGDFLSQEDWAKRLLDAQDTDWWKDAAVSAASGIPAGLALLA